MKKYLVWVIAAVAMVAIIASASFLYDKLSGEYDSKDSGIESLKPSWNNNGPSFTPEEPSQNETEPLETPPEESGIQLPSESTSSEPVQSEITPETSWPETETEPPKPETESDTTASETESETPKIETETETPKPETEPETPKPETEPETPKPETETETPKPETEPETPQPETEPPKVSLKEPDFKVVDMNGNTVNLSDYTGKPIVLNFWASWCPPCQAEMPDFEKMYKKYGDRVNFLMVNAGDSSLSEVRKYVNDNKYTFPTFFDYTDGASIAYSVYNLPTTYFFSADGVARFRAIGMVSADDLESTINTLLNW